jgi:hypothetical protein
MRGVMLFAGLGHVVEVHNAARDSKVARARGKDTYVYFFVVECGLEMSGRYCVSEVCYLQSIGKVQMRWWVGERTAFLLQ